MRKKQLTIQRIIIVIVFILVIIGLAILNQIYNFDNNIGNNANLYENLNIDNSQLNIFYLNVGQADSTFITINGVNMLIDAGNESDGYYIAEFLRAQNVNKIDYFILTHCDEDHIGGAYKILEDIEIGTLYMPQKDSDTNTYTNLLRIIEKNNVNFNRDLKASSERIYNIGNANWKILSVDAKNNENDSSIVVELDYINTKYLFMGDASSFVENIIDANNIDVLKVSHHGSNTATSQEFLHKIKPKYAILSVKEPNKYNLPSQEVIERLKNNNIKTYRTDKDGTIWITSDGNNIQINAININLDGVGRKQAWLFFRRKYLMTFSLFCSNNVA